MATKRTPTYSNMFEQLARKKILAEMRRSFVHFDFFESDMSCAFSFAKFHFQSEGSRGSEHSGECEGLLFGLVFGRTA